MPKPKIFISYSRKDASIVKRLVSQLSKKSYVTIDENIPKREDYGFYIEKEIGLAKYVIVVWSENSVKSEYVRNEATAAKREKKLFPAIIDNCQIPVEFIHDQWIDLREWTKDESKNSSSEIIKSLETGTLAWTPGAEIVNRRCVWWAAALLSTIIISIYYISTTLTLNDEDQYKKLQCKFGGRIGYIEIYNPTLYPIEIRLFHPNTRKEFMNLPVSKQDRKIEEISVGDDWGIKIGSRKIACLSTISTWKEQRHVVDIYQ